MSFPSQQLAYFHMNKILQSLVVDAARRGAGYIFILCRLGLNFSLIYFYILFFPFVGGFKVTTGFLHLLHHFDCVFFLAPHHYMCKLLICRKNNFLSYNSAHVLFGKEEKKIKVYYDKYVIHWRTTHRVKYWKVCSAMWKSIRIFPIITKWKKKEKRKVHVVVFVVLVNVWKVKIFPFKNMPTVVVVVGVRHYKHMTVYVCCWNEENSQ